MILSYRSLLGKRRFLSYIKYRKCIKRKPRRIINLFKKKFKSILFKDVSKRVFSSFLFRSPTKKIIHKPRSYFFKYRMAFNKFYSNILYLYFSVPSFSNSVFEQIKNMRTGDRIYLQVSRHLSLRDVSFFDDFYDDFYFGNLVGLRINGSSSSFSLRQQIYDVSVKHDFNVFSPNIIMLERVRV